MNAQRAKQIEALCALETPPAGWWFGRAEVAARIGITAVKLSRGRVIERGPFAVHIAVDESDAELWLRLTHIPTGMRMASGADPQALADLAVAWEPACDWPRVLPDGIPAEAIKDAEFVARLDDLRLDFETWQRGLVRAEAAAG